MDVLYRRRGEGEPLFRQKSWFRCPFMPRFLLVRFFRPSVSVCGIPFPSRKIVPVAFLLIVCVLGHFGWLDRVIREIMRFRYFSVWRSERWVFRCPFMPRFLLVRFFRPSVSVCGIPFPSRKIVPVAFLLIVCVLGHFGWLDRVIREIMRFRYFSVWRSERWVFLRKP